MRLSWVVSGREDRLFHPKNKNLWSPLSRLTWVVSGGAALLFRFLIVAQREAWPVYLRPSLAHTKSDLYASQYLIRRACVPDTRIDQFRHLPFIPMMPNLKSSCTSVKNTLNNPLNVNIRMASSNVYVLMRSSIC